MTTILDEKTNMRLVKMPGNDNLYLVSIMTDGKCLIHTVRQESDLMIKLTVQNNCTASELTQILDLFSNHIFTEEPDLSGILLKCDENPLLDKIGFKLMSKGSDFLYRKNEQKKLNGGMKK